MDVSKFYAEIPSEWSTRLSVRKALKHAARAAIARFCADISNSKYYETLSLSRLAQVAGMDKRELVAVALRALGDSPALEHPSRLFSLVGLLAGEMTRDEAHAALDFGLSLIEAELSPSTGDGPWREDLLPPVAPNEALAGFVYAKLASPIAKLRWEAAHVVHGPCVGSR
jgi:AraC-like DNA-binding protein